MRDMKHNRDSMRGNERKYKKEANTETGEERLRKENKKTGTR
jgi:hypothetical protein